MPFSAPFSSQELQQFLAMEGLAVSNVMSDNISLQAAGQNLNLNISIDLPSSAQYNTINGNVQAAGNNAGPQHITTSGNSDMQSNLTISNGALLSVHTSPLNSNIIHVGNHSATSGINTFSSGGWGPSSIGGGRKPTQ